MIGLALLGVGAVLIWAAFTKRADAVITALKMDLPAAIHESSGGDGSGGGGGAGGGDSSSADIGTHQGIDASGNVIIITKPYGGMTDSEKDAANRYARQVGNIGSTA